MWRIMFIYEHLSFKSVLAYTWHFLSYGPRKRLWESMFDGSTTICAFTSSQGFPDIVQDITTCSSLKWTKLVFITNHNRSWHAKGDWIWSLDVFGTRWDAWYGLRIESRLIMVVLCFVPVGVGPLGMTCAFVCFLLNCGIYVRNVCLHSS